MNNLFRKLEEWLDEDSEIIEHIAIVLIVINGLGAIITATWGILYFIKHL